MTIFYVDTAAANGGDGTTPALVGEHCAWNTIAVVNAATLLPDDMVLLRRSCIWAEELKPTSAGTSGHPIIFGAYGGGAPPKIIGGTRALDTNSKNYLTCRGIIFSDKEVLANGSIGTRLEYCLLRDSDANGFKALNAPLTVLENCLVIGSRDDGVLADGATAVIDLKNTLVIANGGAESGETYGGGGLNTANGGTINYSYSNITGNGYRPDWNIRGGTDGGNNQVQVLPKMLRAKKDAAFFCITIDDTGYAYAQDVAAAIAPYGGKLTFFVIPSGIDAAGEAALAALAAAGHEIAVHSWTHAGLTVTTLFGVTSANTNPTVDVDVATTTITLWCDEVDNRVTFNWAGNKTITDLKAAVVGKGWTITNTGSIADLLRLASMKDTSGAQAVPFSVLPDVAAPNYEFWNQEINVTRDWITAITGIEPKTMSFPYGDQNAALQAWLKAQGYEGARGTNRIPQTLDSIELYNNRNVYDLGFVGTEAGARANIRHYYELCTQTARMLCDYVHNTSELSPEEWGYIAEELIASGVVLQTFGSYVSAIRASHTPSEDGLTYTKTYPDVFNPHLSSASPCIDVGMNVGLDEDIEGLTTPFAGVYDIGAYEYRTGLMLYKALTGDMKSPEGYGAPFGPWVKDQWYEIEGPVHFDPSGATGPVPNGFFCSPDILQCMPSVKTEYIAQVETDGASVVYENNQWWQKMRVVSIKAWPPSKAALVIDWAEGRAHDVWEGRFASEAALYDAAHYTGQFGTMLQIIEPVYKSLYNDNDFWRFPRWQQFNTLKPEYTRQFERLVRLAYILALCLTGNLTSYGGSYFVRYAEASRPGSWEIIRGFAEDYWAGLAEV